jgi:hypothetical protein
MNKLELTQLIKEQIRNILNESNSDDKALDIISTSTFGNITTIKRKFEELTKLKQSCSDDIQKKIDIELKKLNKIIQEFDQDGGGYGAVTASSRRSGSVFDLEGNLK